MYGTVLCRSGSYYFWYPCVLSDPTNAQEGHTECVRTIIDAIVASDNDGPSYFRMLQDHHAILRTRMRAAGFTSTIPEIYQVHRNYISQ